MAYGTGRCAGRAEADSFTAIKADSVLNFLPPTVTFPIEGCSPHSGT
jgi:hypothetical protein